MRSMTAFTSNERDSATGMLGLELRSVNHRYLELSLRLPDELRVLETPLRERITSRLVRGKVDLSLRLRSAAADISQLRLDEERVARLADMATDVHSKFPHMRISFTELLDFPGVLVAPEGDSGTLLEDALGLLDEALDDLVAMREREGTRLAGFIEERLVTIESLIADIRAHLPEVRAAVRSRLDARLAEIDHVGDPGRLEQEIVIQLSRLDVDEELDRLAAHVGEARHIIAQDQPVGRRLDFLMQELNREANTLGSKSADARTTRATVELKVLIEQMREQVQNLE